MLLSSNLNPIVFKACIVSAFDVSSMRPSLAFKEGSQVKSLNKPKPATLNSREGLGSDVEFSFRFTFGVLRLHHTATKP